jgi:hypothetical protein
LVSELIEQKFHIRLGVTAVGALLAKLGLTPQKPLQRAYQRDPAAIETWQREQSAAIDQCCFGGGGLNAELFVTLLREMMRHRSKPVHLVVDGSPRTRRRR